MAAAPAFAWRRRMSQTRKKPDPSAGSCDEAGGRVVSLKFACEFAGLFSRPMALLLLAIVRPVSYRARRHCSSSLSFDYDALSRLASHETSSVISSSDS
jgi:hypothetical protein